MTNATSSPAEPSKPRRFRLEKFVSDLPLARLVLRLKIATKLILGFGSLVALTLLVVGFSYVARARATEKINTTGDVRVPTALAAARAQASLLRIQSDVRGYLALGDREYRTSYQQDAATFQTALDDLLKLEPRLTAEDRQRLTELQLTYANWLKWPDQLFDLRDDQLLREPAYRLLATDGSSLGGTVLIDINNMIQTQSGRNPPSNENIQILGEMADFQGTFAAMFSAMRGYVTTRNTIYRQEYEVNLSANRFAWNKLASRRASLTTDQQTQLDEIEKARQDFINLVSGQIIQLLEGDRWREDLYLFRSQALPLADHMVASLDQLTELQQTQLQSDLGRGLGELSSADHLTLSVGLIALVLGLGMALVFGQSIGGPIRRLTRVADQIRGGDLVVQAEVESSDEIGTLAETFNGMTTQLRQTMLQTTKEKKRADDLLHVVIPIGVQLSAEKDFNRLLENILLEAKTFCRAGSGTLYLRSKSGCLEHVIVRDDQQNVALGGTTGREITFSPLALFDGLSTPPPSYHSLAVRAAVNGESINVSNAVRAGDFDFRDWEPDRDAPGAGTSFLAIPLRNSDGHVAGVLQLADALDPETGAVTPFDPHLQQMMESFSSLAVAALEAYIREQGLKQEIQQLRIEIDETKRQKQVSEIVETDFFQNLQAKARALRNRSSQQGNPVGSGDQTA